MTRRSTRLFIAAAIQLLLFTLVVSFTPSSSSQTQSNSIRPTGVLRLRVRVKIDEATKGLSRKRFFLIKGTLEQNTPVLDAAKERAVSSRDCFYSKIGASQALIDWLEMVIANRSIVEVDQNSSAAQRQFRVCNLTQQDKRVWGWRWR